jgi:hypothetical protein
MAEIDETKARLQTHEEVCSLRYDGLCARLKRLEGVARDAERACAAIAQRYVQVEPTFRTTLGNGYPR